MKHESLIEDIFFQQLMIVFLLLAKMVVLVLIWEFFIVVDVLQDFTESDAKMVKYINYLISERILK